MQLKEGIITDKSFVKQPDTNTNTTNTLAAEAADYVRKVKKHIEEDDCKCCAEALRKR